MEFPVKQITFWTLRLVIASLICCAPLLAQEADDCLMCHEDEDLTKVRDGRVVSLYFDLPAYEASIHGQAGLTCIACHTDIGQFPHDPMSAVTRRDLAIELYTSCFGCHESEYTDTLDNMHTDALAGGNREAALCTDCHGAHNVHPISDSRSMVEITPFPL